MMNDMGHGALKPVVKKMNFMTCLQITLPAEITCPDRVSPTNKTAANILKPIVPKIENRLFGSAKLGGLHIVGFHNKYLKGNG